MALEEQGEMKEGSRREAEDRPPCSAGDEEQTEQSVQEANPEAGGEDSPDADGSTCVQAQQDTEQPGRQLACLEIPEFLRSDAVEGSTGNLLQKRNSSLGPSCFTPIRKRVLLCLGRREREGREKGKQEEEKQAHEETPGPSRNGSGTRAGEILGPALQVVLPLRSRDSAGQRSGFHPAPRLILCSLQAMLQNTLVTVSCLPTNIPSEGLSQSSDASRQPGPGPGPGHPLTSVLAVCFRGLVLRDPGEDCRAHRSPGGPELLPRSAGHRCLLRCGRKCHPVRTDWKTR